VANIVAYDLGNPVHRICAADVSCLFLLHMKVKNTSIVIDNSGSKGIFLKKGEMI